MTASGPSVLVTGIGLMGGSLAAALAGLGWRVLLHHRRPEVARQAQALGFGTAIERIDEAADVGIAVVCTPVGAIVDAVRTVAARTTAIITDVGSTKSRIVNELSALGDRFVGSHPMAGSHRQGLEHADPGLFRGCVTVVTPVAATPAPALAAVEALWAAIGSRVVRLDPAAHDRAVAEASHLPHVLASAAAAQLGAQAAPLAAAGFRDTTRVAAGAAALWADILGHNADAVDASLEQAIARLAQLRAALGRGDRAAIEAWLEAGRAGRQRYDAVIRPE